MCPRRYAIQGGAQAVTTADPNAASSLDRTPVLHGVGAGRHTRGEAGDRMPGECRCFVADLDRETAASRTRLPGDGEDIRSECVVLVRGAASAETRISTRR